MPGRNINAASTKMLARINRLMVVAPDAAVIRASLSEGVRCVAIEIVARDREVCVLPLPVLRERAGVRVIFECGLPLVLEITLTLTLSRSTGRGDQRHLASLGGVGLLAVQRHLSNR